MLVISKKVPKYPNSNIQFQTMFCYLCGDIVDRSNPYSHFNSPKNSCFGLLFQGVVENALNLDELLEDEEWF